MYLDIDRFVLLLASLMHVSTLYITPHAPSYQQEGECGIKLCILVRLHITELMESRLALLAGENEIVECWNMLAAPREPRFHLQLHAGAAAPLRESAKTCRSAGQEQHSESLRRSRWS